MKQKSNWFITIAIGTAVVVGLWFLLEVVSIRAWSSTTLPIGGHVGTITYRETWGELNRFTMTINEGILWVFGYRMTGPSSYGHFDHWMHTYHKP